MLISFIKSANGVYPRSISAQVFGLFKGRLKMTADLLAGKKLYTLTPSKENPSNPFFSLSMKAPKNVDLSTWFLINKVLCYAIPTLKEGSRSSDPYVDNIGRVAELARIAANGDTHIEECIRFGQREIRKITQAMPTEYMEEWLSLMGRGPRHDDSFKDKLALLLPLLGKRLQSRIEKTGSELSLKEIGELKTIINSEKTPGAADVFIHNLLQTLSHQILLSKLRETDSFEKDFLLDILNDVDLNHLAGENIRYAIRELSAKSDIDDAELFGLIELIKADIKNTVVFFKRDIEAPLRSMTEECENITHFTENYIERSPLLILETYISRIEKHLKTSLGETKCNFSTLEGVTRLLLLASRGPGPSKPIATLDDPGEELSPLEHSAKFLGLVALSSIGLNVPPALSISAGINVSAQWPAISRFVRQTEEAGLGQLAVRSGSFVSMPGQMTTVIGAGLNEDIARTGWQWMRRYMDFMRSYSRSVNGQEISLPVITSPRPELINDYLLKCRRLYKELSGKPLPNSTDVQIRELIKAVRQSWQRAENFRKINGVPDEWGTGVILQKTIWPDEEGSGSGVILVGENGNILNGEFLPGQMGEVLVSGIGSPVNLSKLSEKAAKSIEASAKLIAENVGAAELELVYKENAVWWLQLKRIRPSIEIHGKFVGSLPVTGFAAFSLEQVMSLVARGLPAILVKRSIVQEDYEALSKAAGILTKIGALCSHPGINCIEQGKTAALGLEDDLEVKGDNFEYKGKTIRPFTKISIVPMDEQIVVDKNIRKK